MVEPATARHPAPEDRTWTTAYDALGQPVKVTAPGGVVRERAYDRAGSLTRESGSGAGAATPEKTFGYDSVGRLTRASTPEGDNTYAYDDRGSLISAAGPSGEASYAYDNDGRLVSRTDAAGTANFGYARQQLTSATDPLTGAAQTYRYDGSGALKEIGYGAGQSRSFAYDALGRLDTDTISSSTGATIASTDYGYDTDDHLTSKKTTGTAKAGENTYGYDDAGRLTSWTEDGATTEYRWDKSGNRTGSGNKTAAYDERNRLLSDGDYTYSHTPRGTLASRTSSGLTEEFAFDAFDRLTKAGESGTEYTYDALDRVASRNGADFSYAGFAPDPVKDNNSTYGRGASDELLSVAQGTGAAQLTVTDKHGDVVGDLSATDGAATRLTGSTAFDPFGQRSEATGAESGTVGNAGFQGDWTDPDTGQVNMGARWYDPATGVFDSRDSYTYASGASVLANRYTYGAGSPLDYSDPDGNWPSCIFCKKTLSKAWNKVKQNKHVRTAVKAAKHIYKAVSYVVRHPVSALRKALKFTGKVASYIAHKTGLAPIINAGVRAVKSLGRTTGATEWMRQKAAAARQLYQEARVQITRKARAAVDFVAKHNPVPAIMAAARPLLVVAAAVVTAAPNLPALLVGVTNDVIADAAKVADDIRAAVVEDVGAIVETVRDAADWGAVWEGVKTVGNVVGEVTGFNDIRDCVTTGDMEACAWAVATVAGVALGGAGAGVVRAAKAGRMAAKATKYAERIDKASDTLDRVETAVECTRLASDLVGNSFLAGTEVVMADGTRQPIEKVEAGDEVRATDPTTGKTSAQEVTATIRGQGLKSLVRLTLDTDGDQGDATETLTATAGHPFWVPSLRTWQTADELEPGQWLETGSGTRVQIEAVTAWTQRAAVYNLTVDTAHTYYVAAGDSSVLVHNSGRGRSPGQRPNYDAEGPHTTFVRHGGTGQIKKYAEWAPQSNPRNPAPFELVKRFDLEGPYHTNADGTKVDTPHINLPNGGDARAPEDWERPLGCPR